MGKSSKAYIGVQKKMRYILKSDDIKNNCIKQILDLPGEPVMSVTIEPYKKKRSTDSNSLYWLWVNIISKDTGYTPNELHDMLRSKFLPIVERTIKIKGKQIELTELTSTTSLNSKEFKDYMVEVEMLAISLNIKLPYPEELIYTLK